MAEFIAFLPFLGTFLLVISAIVVALINTRRSKKTSTEPLPPTWPEMWQQMRALQHANDELRSEFDVFKVTAATQSTAFKNVLHDAAEQWPQNHPGPVFDPDDLKALADTIPAAWLNRQE